MKKGSKDKNFIKKPVYDGGLSALRLFIKKHLTYPKTAFQNKVEGTVIIRYTINYKGNVTEAKVVKGIGSGCDEEAIRLVKLLKFKISKTRNIKVQFHKNIQIHFKLPKKSATPVKYTLIPKKDESTIEKKTDKSGFNYTINIG